MLWLKAFHIVAVVTWFAALFYLPRLFVYHAMAEDQISKDRFKIREGNVDRVVTTPSWVLLFPLVFPFIILIPDYSCPQG